VRREPTAARRHLEGSPADVSADAVEYDVRPLTAGQLLHLLGPARFGVGNHRVGAQIPGQIQLRLAPGGADDPRSGRMRQLNQQDAQTATRRQYQHPLPPRDLDNLGETQRGPAVVKQRRRLAQA
jgi:hypothetical protein